MDWNASKQTSVWFLISLVIRRLQAAHFLSGSDYLYLFMMLLKRITWKSILERIRYLILLEECSPNIIIVPYLLTSDTERCAPVAHRCGLVARTGTWSVRTTPGPGEAPSAGGGAGEPAVGPSRRHSHVLTSNIAASRPPIHTPRSGTSSSTTSGNGVPCIVRDK